MCPSLMECYGLYGAYLEEKESERIDMEAQAQAEQDFQERVNEAFGGLDCATCKDREGCEREKNELDEGLGTGETDED